MKTRPTSRGARRDSTARVEGVDYADLGQHYGYALKRAQMASFEAFSRATAGDQITPPRCTGRTTRAPGACTSQQKGRRCCATSGAK